MKTQRNLLLWVKTKEQEGLNLPLLLCTKSSVLSPCRNKEWAWGTLEDSVDLQVHFISVDIIDLRNLVTTMLGFYQDQILFHGERLKPQRSCFHGETGLVNLLAKEMMLYFPFPPTLLSSPSLLLLTPPLSPLPSLSSFDSSPLLSPILCFKLG